MIVKLMLGTRQDPGSKVVIESCIRFTDVQEFDQWLKAQKIARDWLQSQLAAGRGGK